MKQSKGTSRRSTKSTSQPKSASSSRSKSASNRGAQQQQQSRHRSEDQGSRPRSQESFEMEDQNQNRWDNDAERGYSTRGQGAQDAGDWYESAERKNDSSEDQESFEGKRNPPRRKRTSTSRSQTNYR